MGRHDASRPTQEEREEKEKRDRLRQEQLEEDLKALLGLPAGRRYITHLIEKTGVFIPSMTGDSNTFFNEGKRFVGLDIISEIGQVNPREIHKLFGEYYERRIQPGTGTEQ